MIRAMTDEEPRVVNAFATPSSENKEIDASVYCDLVMPGGAKAHFRSSVVKTEAEVPAVITVTGTNGIIHASEWFRGKGASANTIKLETFDGEGDNSVEMLDEPDARDTFYHQLVAFANEVASQVQQTSSAGMPWQYTYSK